MSVNGAHFVSASVWQRVPQNECKLRYGEIKVSDLVYSTISTSNIATEVEGIYKLHHKLFQNM